MYGKFYRMQPKAGQQQAVWDHLFRWEQEQLPRLSGYVGGYLFQLVSAPLDILGLFVFESQASYTRSRDDPEQARWEQHLLALLEHAPERNEGEITELVGEPGGL